MEKVLVMCICIVIFLFIVVGVIEFFIPISANNEMNITCRNTLVQMEKDGTLTDEERNNLISELQDIGFTNISATFNGGTGQEEKITLLVTADYKYSKLVGFLTRQVTTQNMQFNHTTTIRRIIN